MEQKRTIGKGILIFVLVIVLAAALSTRIVFAASGSGEEAAEGKELALNEIKVNPDNICATGYDVVFCIDNSGSIWKQQEIRDEALRSIANLAVGSDIRIGGVYFGNKIYKKQDLTSMENTEGSKKIIKEFLNMTEKDEDNCDTDIGMALEEARLLFENQDSSRERLIILFSDGINEDTDKYPADKDEMDDETIKQSRLLGEKNIPIYCVYLQKKENDEEFLRDLVNYFDSNNSYDEKQFKKVTESEIDTLSEQFAEIFYSMQRDMKFKEIRTDSSGEFSFYVPEMGVKKIQIYLKNDSWYDVELNPLEGEGDIESWEDGNNTYIEAQNPKVGDWRLETGKGDKEGTRGTIAYYAAVSASAEFISERGDDGEAHKNDKQRLKVHFFGEDGNEIPSNSVADVSAVIALKSEDGTLTEKELQLKPAGSGYESEELVWEEYGVYDLSIRLLYEDFLDLVYNIGGRRVEKPVPNKVLIRTILLIIAIAILLIMLVIAVHKLKEVQEYKKFQKESGDFMKAYNQISAVYDSFQEEVKKSGQIKREYENAFKNWKDLCEERLPEELQKDDEEFLKKEDIENELLEIRNIEKDIRDRKENTDKSKEKVKYCVEGADKKKLGDRPDLLHTYMKEIEGTEEHFTKKKETYTHELDKVKAETEKMLRKSHEMEELLDKPVKCTLRLKYKDYRGAKVCNNLKGGYSLDEIQVISRDPAIKTLRDLLDGESTGIYVYGYENDNGTAGLKLVSAKTFGITGGHRKTAELLGGKTYKITLKNIGGITIQVEKENKNVK